jgi:hypothetical protein
VYLRQEKYTSARGREIGRKDKIFFTRRLVFLLPHLIRLRPLCLCGKNYAFARAVWRAAGEPRRKNKKIFSSP